VIKTVRKLLLAAIIAAPCLAVLSAPCANAWSDKVEFVQAVGMIDWVAGKAVASGAGVPPPGIGQQARRLAMAKRAAVIDARRNLLEVVGHIRIDSETTVKNYMTASDVIRTGVRGRLSGSRIESEKILADGTYLVEVSIPLDKVLTPETVRKAARDGSADDKKPDGRTGPGSPGPEPAAPVETDLPDDGPGPVSDSGYTGLVVDVRETDFKPSLAPRLTGPQETIYPAPQLDSGLAADRGLVRYYTDMSLAQQSGRAGQKPLTIKAEAVRDGSEILISAEDAALLDKIASNPGNFLEKAGVVIVF
jgi:hypothetical protein